MGDTLLLIVKKKKKDLQAESYAGIRFSAAHSFKCLPVCYSYVLYFLSSMNSNTNWWKYASCIRAEVENNNDKIRGL